MNKTCCMSKIISSLLLVMIIALKIQNAIGDNYYFEEEHGEKIIARGQQRRRIAKVKSANNASQRNNNKGPIRRRAATTYDDESSIVKIGLDVVTDVNAVYKIDSISVQVASVPTTPSETPTMEPTITGMPTITPVPTISPTVTPQPSDPRYFYLSNFRNDGKGSSKGTRMPSSGGKGSSKGTRMPSSGGKGSSKGTRMPSSGGKGSSKKSKNGSFVPSSAPSLSFEPSSSPSNSPSSKPSSSPSNVPSSKPSSAPSNAPSAVPSANPTVDVMNAVILQFDLLTDLRGDEVTFTLVDNLNGDMVVWSGGPFPGPPTLYTMDTLVDPDGCYTFTIFDAGGDGLQCFICAAEGNYSLTLDGVVIRQTFGSDFTTMESTTFGTGCPPP